MQVHVIHVPWASHSEALQEVRAKVFIEEQGVARWERDFGIGGVRHHRSTPRTDTHRRTNT